MLYSILWRWEKLFRSITFNMTIMKASSLRLDHVLKKKQDKNRNQITMFHVKAYRNHYLITVDYIINQ